MNNELEIAICERDNPELLKKMNLGKVEVMKIKPTEKSFFRSAKKGKIIIKSNVLYKLEEEANKLLEAGHDTIEPIFVKDGLYWVIMTYEKDENSSYLKLKRIFERLKR
ncbi:MAG: hypothetical protein WC758_08105 [Candidatus Woesearchaeota archaeon]|jgi:hypothetical protein